MSFANPVLAYLKEFTRYTRINELIADIDELYSLYAAEHDVSDASHDAALIGWMPAKAFCVVSGTEQQYHVVQHAGSFNVGQVVNNGVEGILINITTGFADTTPVSVSYIGPNKYRAIVYDVTLASGWWLRIRVKLIDTSGAGANPTAEDAIAVVAHHNGAWLFDPPTKTYTWQWLGARLCDQIFGKQTFNKIVNNLYALRELLSVGHVFQTGRHEPFKIMGLGARAFARYTSSTLDSFNIASVEATDTGVYRFTLQRPIPATAEEHYPVIVNVTTTTATAKRACVLRTAGTYFDVAIYDSSHAPVTLGSDVLHAAAWRFV